MISKGHFIGQIVDELSVIAAQVETRCKLNFTDLNIVLEDFFAEILGILFGSKFDNLNKGRSNAPGLDVGNAEERVAFQVTSQKSSTKINETLSKITSEQSATYDSYNILIIGHRQESYTGLDKALCKKCNFAEHTNIWDINSLCAHSLHLPLDRLEEMWKYVQRCTVKIKIELELVETDIVREDLTDRYMEATTQPILSNCQKLASFLSENLELELDAKTLSLELANLVAILKRLSRVTREVYWRLLEECQIQEEADSGLNLNYRTFKNKCSYPGLDDEFGVLIETRLIAIADEEVRDSNATVTVIAIRQPWKGEHELLWSILEYTKIKDLNLKKLIVDLDFSIL